MGPGDQTQAIRPSSRFLYTRLQETLPLNRLRIQRAVWRGPGLTEPCRFLHGKEQPCPTQSFQHSWRRWCSCQTWLYPIRKSLHLLPGLLCTRFSLCGGESGEPRVRLWGDHTTDRLSGLWKRLQASPWCGHAGGRANTMSAVAAICGSFQLVTPSRPCTRASHPLSELLGMLALEPCSGKLCSLES